MKKISVKKIDRIKNSKVYPLTDHEYLFNKTHSECVEQVIDTGISMVQLRDKVAPVLVLYKEALKIAEITKKNNVLFIVNDRVDLALLVNADGVHLGQDDFPVEEARKILGDDRIIGISTHSREQVVTAMKTSADYIAYGPIYETNTKPDTEPVQGIKLLEEIVNMVDRPLFAIGAITLSNLEEVLRTGVAGVAVISDIFKFPDPRKRVLEYLKKTGELSLL